MDPVNFYQPGAAPQQGVDFSRMAQMLMAQQRPQGQGTPNAIGSTPNATGSTLNGLNQLAGAGVQALARNSQAGANTAATALNGGVATVGQAPAAFSRFGDMLGGIFGA